MEYIIIIGLQMGFSSITTEQLSIGNWKTNTSEEFKYIGCWLSNRGKSEGDIMINILNLPSEDL